jgi:hypothetical protein
MAELWWEIFSKDMGDWWVGCGWWAVCGLVASNPCANLAYFSDKGVVGFGGLDLQCVPEDIVVVEQGIGGEDRARSESSFLEFPPQDIATGVG